MKKTDAKKKIRLDFDGVILDAPSLKEEVALEMFKRPVPLAEMSSDQILAGKSSITLAEYRELQLRVYSSESTARAQPLGGSLDAIRHWLAEGHDVQVVTARTGETLEDARAWLIARGVVIPMTGVGHRVSKLPHLRGADLFVDDDPQHVREASAVVRHAYLYRWPFNAHEALPSIAALSELIDSNQV